MIMKNIKNLQLRIFLTATVTAHKYDNVARDKKTAMAEISKNHTFLMEIIYRNHSVEAIKTLSH